MIVSYSDWRKLFIEIEHDNLLFSTGTSRPYIYTNWRLAPVVSYSDWSSPLFLKKKEINLDNLLFSTDPIYIKIEKKFSNCKSNRIFAIVQKHVTTSFMKRILEIVIIYFCHVFSAIIVGHCAYNKIIHSQFLHVIVIRHCCKK